MLLRDVNVFFARALRHWWIILLLMLITICSTAWQLVPGPNRASTWWCLIVQRTPECRAAISTINQYEITSKLVIGPDPQLSREELVRVAPILNNGTTVATYADFLSSFGIVDSAFAAVPVPVEQRFAYQVRVVEEPSSNVLRLTVRGPSKETTEKLSRALQDNGRALSAQLFPLYRLTSLETDNSAVPVQESSRALMLMLAALVGLVLGMFAALWYDSILGFRARRQSLQQSVNRETVTLMPTLDAEEHDSRVTQRISVGSVNENDQAFREQLGSKRAHP